MAKVMTGKEILDLPMEEGNDADVKTIREYLKELLSELWRKRDGFSGKRPFGNSGWAGELEIALVQGGAIDGSIDGDGYLDECDGDAAKKLIEEAIAAL